MTEPSPIPDRRSAVSSSFRRQLGVELDLIKSSGHLTDEAATEIRRAYGIDDVGAEGSQKLIWVIFLVGVLLIGCGVIALVAWHWEDMSQTLQLLIIVGAMITAHVSGYLLWFHGNRPRLGHALVLLGTLLYFANIGLIAQMFHITSDGRGIWIALAVGAAAMALALDSVPNFQVAMVSVIVWAMHSFGGTSSVDTWYAPLLGIVIALTVRIVRRTESSLSLRAGWLTGTVLAARAVDHIFPDIRGESLFILVTLSSGAVAAGLSAHLRRAPSTTLARRRDLAETLETLAAVLIAAATFFGGFLDVHSSFRGSDFFEWTTWGFSLAFIGISLAIAFRQALTSAPSSLMPDSSAGARVMSFTPLGLTVAALVAAAGIPMTLPAAIASNIAVLMTGSVLAATGVREERRGRFWFGTALVLATVLARFFEYETNLWLKAAAFIASGVLVLVIGLAFERRIRASRTTMRGTLENTIISPRTDA